MDANAYSIPISTNIVFPVNAPLPGLTSFVPCSFAMTAKICPSWALTSSLLAWSTYGTSWLTKSFNEFNVKLRALDDRFLFELLHPQF